MYRHAQVVIYVYTADDADLFINAKRNIISLIKIMFKFIGFLGIRVVNNKTSVLI